MRYFPINLNVRGKPAVIIGGGAVAARKCIALLAAGARVTIIAPTLSDSLQKLAEHGQVTHLAREYTDGDLANACLVFAATDSRMVNRSVAKEAKKCGILSDIADAPEMSDFTSPAVINRGDLLITIATGGECPALARVVRIELEKSYGPEYAELIEILGKVREKLLTEKANNPYNKRILNELVEQDLPALLKKRSSAEIDHLLLKLCGPGFSLAELGIGKKDTE